MVYEHIFSSYYETPCIFVLHTTDMGKLERWNLKSFLKIKTIRGSMQQWQGFNCMCVYVCGVGRGDPPSGPYPPKSKIMKG